MLLSLILLLATSILIWSWGRAILGLSNRVTGEATFITAYLVGLCFLCLVANTLSLFVGLGSPIMLFLLLIPLFNKRIYSDLRSALAAIISKDLSLRWLLGTAILLFVVIHPWEIRHPDTLTYQNNLVSFALSGPHPIGIIELKNQYGYGGSYFSLAALFSFHFLTGKILTYVNISLAAVFLVYLCQQLDRSVAMKKPGRSLATLLLLGLVFYEYTFFRLAVTSVAPDTPAAIIGLFSLAYFLRPDRKGWMLVLLTTTAVTLKLSLTPLLLLPLWHAWERRTLKEGVINVAISALIMTPFIAKNILSTGYLIYPMANTQVVHTNYTPSPALVKAEADYIKAYARNTNAGRAKEDVQRIVNMPWRTWMPIWWSQTQWAGRFLLITFLLGVFWMTNRFLAKSMPDHVVYLLVTLVGFSFWIILAPSVRFGSAFLLAPLVFYVAQKDSQESIREEGTSKASSWLHVLITLLILALLAYITYRLIYFMDSQTIWFPKGPIR